MCKVVIIGGGKGGVGKSAVTMGVVDTLSQRGEKVIVVESDDSNPDVFKAINKILPCHVINIDIEDGYIALCNLIEKNPDSWVVVNTPARATDPIMKHGAILGDTCKELGRELVMLWPINRQRDSLELLRKMMDNTEGVFTSTFVVVNTYWGTPEKFARYNTSKTKERATGTVIFPELNDLVADKLNDTRLALSNAAEGLSIAERSALNRYRTAIKSGFDGVL